MIEGIRLENFVLIQLLEVRTAALAARSGTVKSGSNLKLSDLKVSIYTGLIGQEPMLFSMNKPIRP